LIAKCSQLFVIQAKMSAPWKYTCRKKADQGFPEYAAACSCQPRGPRIPALRRETPSAQHPAALLSASDLKKKVFFSPCARIMASVLLIVAVLALFISQPFSRVQPRCLPRRINGCQKGYQNGG